MRTAANEVDLICYCERPFCFHCADYISIDHLLNYTLLEYYVEKVGVDAIHLRQLVDIYIDACMHIK